MWKRNLYAAWITQILSLTGFGFVLPFLPYFIQELGVTAESDVQRWTAWISSLPALSMGIMGPVWGIVADRLGRKLMILRAMLFGAIIMFLLSRATSVGQVLALRILQGVFTGTITASATLVAAGTPKHRLSYALGLLSSSNFIGISLGPLLGGIAAEAMGYRRSFLLGSCTLLAGLAIALVALREPERRRIEADDEGIEFQLRDMLTPQFLLPFLLWFLLRFCRSLPGPYMPLIVQEIRGTLVGTPRIMGLVAGGAGAATALAGLTLSRLGDRPERASSILRLLVVATGVSVPLFFARSLWSLATLYVVSTFFAGGVEPIVQSTLSGMTHAKRRGLLFGAQTTIGSAGWFLGPLTGGVLALRFSTAAVFIGYSVILAVAVLVALASRRRGGR